MSSNTMPPNLPGHDIFCTPQNEAFYKDAVYENLDNLKREIRLLRILPDRRNGLIECERLPKMALEELQGSYCALSYCAGDPKKTQEILVDGLKFNVFANLGRALAEAHHFWKKTHHEKDCLLWVDQICINQKNLSERAYQVGFMREIYSSADQVLICLSTQKQSGHGIKWLQRLHHDVPHFENDINEINQGVDGYDLDMNIHLPLDRVYSKSLYSIRLNEYLWANTNDEQFIDGWLAMYDIMESPWWRRAWVYQEFISSTQSHFLYGHQSISWTTLSPILASYCGNNRWLLSKNTIPTLTGPKYYPEHHRLTRIRNREEQAKIAVDAVGYCVGKKNCWSGPVDIKSLLAHSRNCHSSDMRDKIYAFLGLAHPGYGIVPDYSPSNPVVDVFIEIAKKIILFDHGLDCLADAPDSRGLLADSLPSWVPDWTCKEEKIIRTIMKKPFFPLAPKPDPAWSKLGASFKFALDSSGHHILIASGVLVDTLDRRAISTTPILMPLNYAVDIAAQEFIHYFSTSGGLFVICTCRAQVSDQVWILRGSHTPFILRATNDGYILVSIAHVYNMADLDNHSIASADRFRTYGCRHVIAQVLGGEREEHDIVII